MSTRGDLRLGRTTFLLIAALFAAFYLHSSAVCHASEATGLVKVINKSHRTGCVEEDNVDLEFESRNIAGFTIRASYPSYMGNISTEKLKPNFHGCPFDFSRGPGSPKRALPQEITFYKSPRIWLVGVEDPNFWRPNQVPVIVGGRREYAPLVQVWISSKGKGEQIMAFYPADGYWRLRPLPYGKMRLTSYGSSVLVGPVENDAGRPYVAIKEIRFDPPTRSFRLDFVDGGWARLTLRKVDAHECTLAVAFAGALPTGRPFAAVRSMFVDENYADVARIVWKKDQPAEPVLAFKSRRVSSLWMGRTTESMHNNTAPDHLFSDFFFKRRRASVANL